MITIDGGTGRVFLGAVDARPAAAQRGLRDRPRLGRRAAPAEGARERRHARGRGEGARVRRRGHRPLPHRAHVLRRGAAAGRAGDDPRRRRGRAPRRARPAAAVPAVRLRGDLRGDGRAAGDDPPARPAAARVPAAARGRRPTSDARAGSARSTSRTRCSARAAAGSGSVCPEIYEMQVRAIVRAARAVQRAHRRGAARRDHAPARRLRRGAAPAARADDRGRPRRRAGSTYLSGR